MKRYTEYRASGHEWLGEIPNDWSILFLSQIVTQVKNKNSTLSEQNLLSLSYGRIKRKPIDTKEGLLPASFDGYNIIEANDIVLRLTDLQNDHTSLRVGLSPERGIITSAYTTIRPRDSRSAEYLYYVLHTFDIRKGFYGMGSGVRQGLNYDEVKKLLVPFPSIDEQQEIATYLKQKVSDIDTVISEAKASIDEYKSWKASIIYEAVTKGLNKDVAMKDSGIEWIGSIPESWSMKRIKNVSEFMPKCDFSHISNNDEITFTPMECIRTGYFENRKKTFGEIEGSYTQYAEGDIVIAKVTPCFENKNICIMKGLYSGLGLGSSELFVLRPKSILDRFLFYFLLHQGFIDSGCASMTGTGGLKRVSSVFLRDCRIPVPDQQTQVIIADYLDQKNEIINKLIAEKESLISDLEAYKKSLIFEVVTGKRKVV